MTRNDRVRLGSTNSTYSAGIVASGERLVFISGQVATDPTGAVIGVGSLEEQARHIFKAIERLLAEAGGDLGNVAKLTTYVTDMRLYADFSRVRGEVFSEPYPASTAIEVSHLVKPEMLIEIDAIAIL